MWVNVGACVYVLLWMFFEFKLSFYLYSYLASLSPSSLNIHSVIIPLLSSRTIRLPHLIFLSYLSLSSSLLSPFPIVTSMICCMEQEQNSRWHPVTKGFSTYIIPPANSIGALKTANKPNNTSLFP